MKQIIKLEKRVNLPEIKGIIEDRGNPHWILYTDLEKQEQRLMPESQLYRFYEEIKGTFKEGEYFRRK